MAKDIVGLELGGDTVTLQKFAASVTHFQTMIRDLTDQIAPDAQIDWVVQTLEVGSATQRYRGVAGRVEDESKIALVTDAYQRLTKSYQFGEQPKFPKKLREDTERIINLIDEEVPYVKFETDEDESVVRQSIAKAGAAAEVEVRDFGAVEGRVQTISSRGSLRFTLYDTAFDRAVACYLDESQEEQMVGVWGQLAIVEGIVRRDPISGRPISVRQISHIETLSENTDNKAILAAEGVAPSRNGLSAEEAIRRIRDAS